MIQKFLDKIAEHMAKRGCVRGKHRPSVRMIKTETDTTAEVFCQTCGETLNEGTKS